MARNGSGTQSTPNTFVSGNTITASAHNQNWTDIASEMTNSVAADGQTSMTGPLRAANGTAAAPSHTFASDTDSGMYRIAGNNVGVAVNGAKVLDVSTTGLDVTGEIKRNGITPYLVGEIKIWPGSAIPSGFLACNGASLLRASYPDLFTAIGTTYGAADGTHFTLPDLTGRAVAGKEASATRLTTAGGGIDGATLGATGGVQNVTLAANQIPSLTSVNASQAITVTATRNIPTTTGTISNVFPPNTGAQNVAQSSGADWSAITAISGNNSISVTYTNGSQVATKTVMPAIILNYIIFAGV